MKQKSKFRGTNIITLLAFMTGLQAATDALRFRDIVDIVVDGYMATWLLFSVVGLMRRRMWGVTVYACGSISCFIIIFGMIFDDFRIGRTTDALGNLLVLAIMACLFVMPAAYLWSKRSLFQPSQTI